MLAVSQSTKYNRQNKTSLRCFFKNRADGADVTWFSRLFQTLAAATAKTCRQRWTAGIAWWRVPKMTTIGGEIAIAENPTKYGINAADTPDNLSTRQTKGELTDYLEAFATNVCSVWLAIIGKSWSLSAVPTESPLMTLKPNHVNTKLLISQPPFGRKFKASRNSFGSEGGRREVECVTNRNVNTTFLFDFYLYTPYAYFAPFMAAIHKASRRQTTDSCDRNHVEVYLNKRKLRCLLQRLYNETLQ